VTADRHLPLDVLRGFAVMGILLMNIVAFAMPSHAYINPRAFGGTTMPDLLAWAVNFVLVDGKMRGLFSLLFGASMLLVIERARAAGQSGTRVHLSRMAWLAVFGLIHLHLIWFGDILTLYAICGAVALLLVNRSPTALFRWAGALIALNFVLWALIVGSGFMLEYAAGQPGARPATLHNLQELLASLGEPGNDQITRELQSYQGSYADALAERTRDGAGAILFLLVSSGLETVGLMALGMALYKNGFLTGAWSPAEIRQLMVRAYAIGLPAMIAIAAFCFFVDFDTLRTAAAVFVLATPFRFAVMFGHVALVLLIVRHVAMSPFVERVAAVGQAAFTNYLGTSIVVTSLFYGYGAGWFGTLSRWQIYLVPPIIWMIMLLWSKPWLARYRYGPLEWLWRSLARGSAQPLLR